MKLILALALLSLCACTTVKAPDVSSRPALQLVRLASLPYPPSGQGAPLTIELIDAHNEAAGIANKNAAVAEAFDKEAGIREQEVGELKQAIKEQSTAHTWENFSHWVLEGGLVAALILVVSGI